MFCIMIFVVLSLYAGKTRKLNIGVNILSGLFVRQRGGNQAHSNTEHWIACACGAKLDQGEHTFDDKGVCTVCGFAKNGPWWILIVVAAVICIVILVIILLVKKKKNDASPPAAPAPGGPAGSDNLSGAQKNEEDTDDPKKE